MTREPILLPSCCWPNLAYFKRLLDSEQIAIERFDNFEKQTYRNRYAILTANGVLQLTVPIVHTGRRQTTGEVRIFYGDRWQARHWGALTSAYRSSPWFEYFEDDIRPLFFERTELLADYNMRQLEIILRLLRIEKRIGQSEKFEPAPAARDCRELRFIEKNPPGKEAGETTCAKPYYQTFGSRFGFVPNLSMLDLVFNVGLKSAEILEE